jgi:hypothetical protein
MMNYMFLKNINLCFSYYLLPTQVIVVRCIFTIMLLFIHNSKYKGELHDV